MKEYRHTQMGYLMLGITFMMMLIFLGLSLYVPEGVESGIESIVMILVLFILLSFSTLQTIVTDTYIKIKFGYGIFTKQFLLSDIASVTVVQNRWYYGWGIRVWFWPRMNIYNVSGFGAVELVLKNGKIYRIGTDVPQELLGAITSRLHK